MAIYQVLYQKNSNFDVDLMDFLETRNDMRVVNPLSNVGHPLSEHPRLYLEMDDTVACVVKNLSGYVVMREYNGLLRRDLNPGLIETNPLSNIERLSDLLKQE
jgi:hypothetical protein